MVYKLDTGVSRNGLLIPWNYIFRSLSIPQFSQVFESLRFPFSPTEKLRQLAHDFVIAFEINLGHPAPEAAFIDLLEGVSPSDPSAKRSEALFTNTFSYLEKMGYAPLIYDWGRHTSDFYNYEDVKQLGSWRSLLLKWAVLEQVEHPMQIENKGLSSSDLDIVLAKWKDTYTRIPPEPFTKRTFAPLPVLEETRLNLLTTILQSEAKQIRFEAVLDQILVSAKVGEWEDIVLRSGVGYIWMKGEAKFRRNLEDWNTITKKLPADEMEILTTWALKDTYHKLKLPLPDFTMPSKWG